MIPFGTSLTLRYGLNSTFGLFTYTVFQTDGNLAFTTRALIKLLKSHEISVENGINVRFSSGPYPYLLTIIHTIEYVTLIPPSTSLSVGILYLSRALAYIVKADPFGTLRTVHQQSPENFLPTFSIFSRPTSIIRVGGEILHPSF